MIHNLVALAIVLGTLCLTSPIKAEEAQQNKENVSKIDEQKQVPTNVIAADTQGDNEEKVTANDKEAMAFNLEEDDDDFDEN